ncbi:hypothetical protein J6590_000702, partial [Homalodisca vitripennis]
MRAQEKCGLDRADARTCCWANPSQTAAANPIFSHKNQRGQFNPVVYLRLFSITFDLGTQPTTTKPTIACI